MAFPFVFQSNFEDGNTGFDSTDDTGGTAKIAVKHYAELSRIPGLPAPYLGAYSLHVDLTTGDAIDHTVTEADINISANAENWFRWYMWTDLAPTADDTFNILELKASSTVELAVGMRWTNSSGLMEIGVGETAPTVFAPWPQRQWNVIELYVSIDAGTNDDGAADLYVNGNIVASVSALNQGAVTDGIFGVQDQLATTTGHILFDEFIHDDGRLGSTVTRWPLSFTITKDRHVCLGSGEIDGVTVIDGGSGDSVVEVFDTDKATATGTANRLARVGTPTASVTYEKLGPVCFQRGAFVKLSGTNTLAEVTIKRSSAYGSDAHVRNHGSKRKEAPGGA